MQNWERANNGRGHGRPSPVYDKAGCLSVTCRTCKRIVHALDAYRCFDCGAHLCAGCVPSHFGNRHEPHPMHLEEYTEALRANALLVESLQEELSRLRACDNAEK